MYYMHFAFDYMICGEILNKDFLWRKKQSVYLALFSTSLATAIFGGWGYRQLCQGWSLFFYLLSLFLCLGRLLWLLTHWRILPGFSATSSARHDAHQSPKRWRRNCWITGTSSQTWWNATEASSDPRGFICGWCGRQRKPTCADTSVTYPYRP